jgi:nicotinamidase-related amidase
MSGFVADSNTLKVLVVVDVQNCFMYNDKDGTSGATFLNLESGASGTTGMEQSKAIIQEIAGLAEKNELIVFTRDFHPINHISFAGDEGRPLVPIDGTWPRHCRNPMSICKARNTTGGEDPVQNPLPNIENVTKIGDVDRINEAIPDVELKVKDLKELNGQMKKIKDIPIYGTELSYMYYGNEQLRNIIYTLNTNNKSGIYKIGLIETKQEYPSKIEPTNINPTASVGLKPPAPLQYNNKKYITLTKGERCDQESYSAFNYHLNYSYDGVKGTPEKPLKEQMSISKKNSTGLWEFIIDQSRQTGKKNIEVTVCGLVGNVCVMYSVTEGIAMWNEVYAEDNEDINIKMIYSLAGNRFTGALAPNKVKPFEDITELNGESGVAFLNWMNIVAPISGSNGKYNISTAKDDIEAQNKIPGFTFLDYNGEPISVLSYKMEPSTEPTTTTTMGGNVKHKHTYKYRKCTVCGCKSRKARKDCTRKHNKRNKMGGKRSRKH